MFLTLQDILGNLDGKIQRTHGSDTGHSLYHISQASSSPPQSKVISKEKMEWSKHPIEVASQEELKGSELTTIHRRVPTKSQNPETREQQTKVCGYQESQN